MNLYTSYFARINRLRDLGFDNLVCVAGYAPDFFKALPNARFYPSLAPRKDWFWTWKNGHLPNEWYVQKYEETVLSRLDPEKVVQDLGDRAVLLCYEKPGDFCHRHLIAQWLNRSLGICVDEVKFV